MKENLPKSSPITLDSLFQANKARFDQIFGVKTEELKTRGLTPIPVRPQDLVSASMGTRGNSVDYTALLNEKFGNGWSFEIAESSVENGHASVLGK
ncbi:MAG: hypothetical protein OEW39_07640, partial [Deltaproteobacteria bacterium]|nr:hypothetical protein [Deltaproteobacteria bacterium]